MPNNNPTILRFENINSTHLYALDLIENGKIVEHDSKNEDIACIIIAENQTNGIGRCNRKWISVRGNLFISIITKNSAGDDLGQLSLAIGCAVRETILEACGSFAELKLHWPNDVYYSGKKISGILICKCLEYLVISVGINTNVSPRGFASIRDITKNEVDNEAVVSILLSQLKKWISELDSYGFSHVRSYWLQNVCYVGQNIEVRNGKEIISGVFSDIDEKGRAVLFINGKYFFISSGDVFSDQERIVVT